MLDTYVCKVHTYVNPYEIKSSVPRGRCMGLCLACCAQTTTFLTVLRYGTIVPCIIECLKKRFTLGILSRHYRNTVRQY